MAEEEAQMPQDPAAGGDAAAGADAAGADAAAEQKPAKKGGGIGAFMPLILMPVLCAGMAAGVWSLAGNGGVLAGVFLTGSASKEAGSQASRIRL